MSRPPRPVPERRTGTLRRTDAELVYFEPLYTDLFAMVRDVFEAELGLGAPPQGDLADVFLDASAVVGHVLGRHQDLYAGESWIGTARTPRSLVRHGRRLDARPDPGLSATGAVVLEIGEGLSGIVEAGLPLGSTPLGELPAEDYETLDDLGVDAAWNRLAVAQPEAAAMVSVGDTFEIEGTPTLEPGELAVVVGQGHWHAYTVVAVRPHPERAGHSLVDVAGGATANFDPSDYVDEDTGRYRLLAAPATRAHLFGHGADPQRYPPPQLRDANGTEPLDDGEPDAGFFYFAFDDAGSSNAYDSRDHYLDTELADPLLDTWVVKLTERGPGAASPTVYRVVEESQRTVSFTARTIVTTQQVTELVSDNANPPTITVNTEPVDNLRESSISGTVTTLRLRGRTDPVPTRVQREGVQEPSAAWLGHWRTQHWLVRTIPNDTKIDTSLLLDGSHPGLRPGRLVALQTVRGPQVTQIVRLTLVVADEATTRIDWDPVTQTDHVFELGNVVVRGNVVEISHGKTISEILGGSDGVQPFLTFELKKSPVTHLPTADTAVPEFELRVGGIRWTRVPDFAASGPDDRHYQLILDETQQMRVRFGDGAQGAVPAAGARHIVANYRVGLGRTGNAAPGRVRRIKGSHPLVQAVAQPVSVGGGADPASLERLRREASRVIRTFDRAVSVEDHAQLVLTYPGVARARAAWDATRGRVQVWVADDEGTGFDAPMRQILTQFLTARRAPGSGLEVLPAQRAPINLSTRVLPHPDFLWDDVVAAVRAALLDDDPEHPGLFAFAGRELGQAAYASEVLERIIGLESVVTATLEVYDAEGRRGTQDVLRCGPSAWLALSGPGDVDRLVIAEAGPAIAEGSC